MGRLLITITILSELEEQLRERAETEGLTTEAYVERLIREDEEWRERAREPLDETNPEFEDIHSAVMQGLEEAERGERSRAKIVFAELRAKEGTSR